MPGRATLAKPSTTGILILPLDDEDYLKENHVGMMCSSLARFENPTVPVLTGIKYRQQNEISSAE